MIPRIGLVGIGGYGASHLGAVLAAHRDGRVRLIGVADPRPPVEAAPRRRRAPPDATGLFAAGGTDIVIISTPIHTHAAIALAAMDHGNDVLLEKPPAASLAEFTAISERATATGALVQVGFQSLGSSAIPAIRAAVADGEIGDVQRYGASGVWVRDDRYWSRSPWAGRRTLDGAVVADGVLTNPSRTRPPPPSRSPAPTGSRTSSTCASTCGVRTTSRRTTPPSPCSPWPTGSR